jgi:hypothetical protein
LKKNILLYEVILEPIENGIIQLGLYNASGNRWEIPLAEDIHASPGQGFLQTSFEDWIVQFNGLYWKGEEQIFYNISTRKKYMNMYYFDLYSRSTMSYWGNSYKDDVIIEDF